MAKKNQRKNELYIGKDFLNVEGRTIKHPALIDHYANVDTNKTRDSLIETIGLDIETNHLTGEMRLLGFYEGNNRDYSLSVKDGEKLSGYSYYTDNFLKHLLGFVRYADKQNKHLAHWNKLDAFQIFRLFALNIDNDEVINVAMKRYDNIQGEWNRTKHCWNIKPVIAVEIDGVIFGIQKVIRGSLQFFIDIKGRDDIINVWSYNIASLYIKGLEKEADINSGGRFDWYNKVDESAHLVDWDRFENDINFRENIVLKSNELDCKSAMALAYEVQKDFCESFGSYPVSLISQGSHARSGLTAQITNDLISQGYEGDILQEKRYREINSISFISILDELLEKYDKEKVKDFYLLTTEAYSGGMIETIRYGYADEGWYVDIASAYPSVIQNLFDLRNSRLEYGEGEPPRIDNSYIICRGLVSIPETLQYHPITIKHPIHKDTNIRPTGSFYASYTSEERDFIIENGGSFRNEVWYALITEGKQSVLSKVSLKLIDLRNELIKQKKRAEGQVKRIGNSLYGILFEAVPVYEEGKELEPIKIGYRAGEFWNSLYATFITSRTRLILSKACVEIEKKGGEPILLMTDSISWKGKKTDLPRDLDLPFGKSGIRDKKTLGYFETPEKIKNVICFGSGRYGFTQDSDNGTYTTSKRRGMVITGYVNPDNIPLEKGFSWNNFIRLIKYYNTTILGVKTRKLISTGILSNSLKYKLTDLGRIVEEEAEIDLIAGKNKRDILQSDLQPEIIATSLVKSTAIHLDYNVYAAYDYFDGTLPFLRSETNNKPMKSRKIRKREVDKVRQQRYRTLNRDSINNEKKDKYKFLRASGFSSKEASFKNNYSWERLEAEVKNR